MSINGCDVCGEYTERAINLIAGVHTRLCPEHRTEFDGWAHGLEEWEQLQDLRVRVHALIRIGEEEGAASYAKSGREILRSLRPKVEAWLKDVKERN